MNCIALTGSVRDELYRLQDLKYRDLQIRILPTVKPETIIGARTPELRKLAAQMGGTDTAEAFLEDLPHKTFDENQLHAFLVSEIKDYPECITRLDRFLPFVDNWATCDQMSPRVFRKHRKELPAKIREWIASPETYTVRFGVGMLMQHFLDKDFDPAYPELAASVRSEEYYVRMMVAWYFATALAKQYETALPFIEKQRLEPWTHNKAIQKAIESYRITPEQKTYLRSLKIKEKRI